MLGLANKYMQLFSPVLIPHGFEHNTHPRLERGK